MSDECTCHLSPPCAFCCSLDEGEALAFMDGGYDGLAAYREKRDDEADEVSL